MKLNIAANVRSFAAIIMIVCAAQGYSHAAQAQQIDLHEYAGKVVYLDFWASWCAPCRQSFPWMNDVQAAYAGQGLVIIAVNVDKEPSLAQKFLDAHRPVFRIAYDPKGTIAAGYDIKAMPTSILIGRDGRVRVVHQGFHPEEEYEYVSHIEAALREGAHAGAGR